MIAVAICTYNPDERLLARALAAVEAQTLRPSECLIVDNASDRAVAALPFVVDFLRRSPWARSRVAGSLRRRRGSSR